jgi:hypothetical protein
MKLFIVWLFHVKIPNESNQVSLLILKYLDFIYGDQWQLVILPRIDIVLFMN